MIQVTNIQTQNNPIVVLTADTAPQLQTFEQCANDFLGKLKSKLKSQTKLKESTLSRYDFICERHLIPYFKNSKIHEINDEQIDNFINYKLNDGGLKNGNSMSQKSVNDIVVLLLQIIRAYVKFDTDIEKPSYKQSEVIIFTEAEYNKLKKYLSTGTDNRKLGIIVAMLTGIRLGELCALKWKNIDLESGYIFIDKTIQRVKNINNADGESKTKVIIDTPKSASSIRKIPIQSILIELLKQFKGHGNTYLLTNTTSYIEPRIYQRHFKSYLKTCNIKSNKFHVLRHTFATTAVARGMDIKTLSITLGHSDVSFTMKMYVHPNIEHRRKQIEKLAVGF